MKYFIEYNAKYIAEFKTLKGCMNYIHKKNLKNDENNTLSIVTDNGDYLEMIDELYNLVDMEYKVVYYEKLNLKRKYIETLEEVKTFINTLDKINNSPVIFKLDKITGYYQLFTEID